MTSNDMEMGIVGDGDGDQKPGGSGDQKPGGSGDQKPGGSGDQKEGDGGDDKAGDDVIYRRDDDKPERKSLLGEDKQQQSKQSSPSCCRELFDYVGNNRLFTGCIVVNAILIVAIFGVTIAWFNFADTTIVDFDPSEQLYCMKCDNVDAKVNKDKYFDRNKDECCATKDGQYLPYVLNKYVEQTVNDTYTEKPLFQLCLNSTTAEKAQAYAQIAAISNTDTANNNLHLIKWDTTAISNQSNPLVPFFNRVRYDQGNFIVDRPGYYHIYSRLVFDLKNETAVFPAVIRHLVLKYRKDYNVGEKLLEGYATQCEAVANTKFSSFVFGDFFITNTDKVQVLLNDPKYIDAKMSYFGMYLI